jgi:hypothetical protein
VNTNPGTANRRTGGPLEAPPAAHGTQTWTGLIGSAYDNLGAPITWHEGTTVRYRDLIPHVNSWEQERKCYPYDLRLAALPTERE